MFRQPSLKWFKQSSLFDFKTGDGCFVFCRSAGTLDWRLSTERDAAHLRLHSSPVIPWACLGSGWRYCKSLMLYLLSSNWPPSVLDAVFGPNQPCLPGSCYAVLCPAEVLVPSLTKPSPAGGPKLLWKQCRHHNVPVVQDPSPRRVSKKGPLALRLIKL